MRATPPNSQGVWRNARHEPTMNIVTRLASGASRGEVLVGFSINLIPGFLNASEYRARFLP